MCRGLEIKSDHNSSIRLARAGARVFLTWRSKSLACHFVAQTLRAQALKRNLRNKRKRMQTETQMAAALLISTAAMPPLTADHDGLTHNGRSARYGIKPACVNFRLAIQGNLFLSVACALLGASLRPALCATRTPRQRSLPARPRPPCNRP